MQGYRAFLIAAAMLTIPAACNHSNSVVQHHAPLQAVVVAPAPASETETALADEALVRSAAQSFVRALLENDPDEASRHAHASPEHRVVIEAIALSLSSDRALCDALAARFNSTPGRYPEQAISRLSQAKVEFLDEQTAQLIIDAKRASMTLCKIDGRWLADVDSVIRSVEPPTQLFDFAREKVRITDELIAEIQAGKYLTPQAVQHARVQRMKRVANDLTADAEIR